MYFSFLNVHTGAFGVDFSSLTKDTVDSGLSRVSKGLLQHGVTAYVPTIVTSESDYYKRVLPLLTPRAGGRDGAAVLGVHCEGPFINIEKKGAHEQAFIQPSLSPALLQDVYGSQLDNVRLVTLAPELEGGLETIAWLKERTNEKEIVVAIGHSMANLRQAEEAVRSGASLITHLFNAMLPVSVLCTEYVYTGIQPSLDKLMATRFTVIVSSLYT